MLSPCDLQPLTPIGEFPWTIPVSVWNSSPPSFSSTLCILWETPKLESSNVASLGLTHLCACKTAYHGIPGSNVFLLSHKSHREWLCGNVRRERSDRLPCQRCKSYSWPYPCKHRCTPPDGIYWKSPLSPPDTCRVCDTLLLGIWNESAVNLLYTRNT